MAAAGLIQQPEGHSAQWPAVVRPVVVALMRDQAVPGLVIVVAQQGLELQFLTSGSDAQGRPLADDTLFPVASITKLATALSVLRLVAAGRLSLDDDLARHLPEAAAARGGSGVTLRSLLSHTSGLPYDLPDSVAPYRPGLSWPVVARACLATPLANPPHTRVRYSNVGPGLLALVVERLSRQPFAAALADLVLKPLDIEGYLGAEPRRLVARVAGDFGEHAGTDLEPINSAFWRSLALPWAGLVTTAAGALRLVRAYAGFPPDYLPSALLAEATRDQTAAPAGDPVDHRERLRWSRAPWGLGVELRGTKAPHAAPPDAAPESYGHVGGSGGLVWADPAAGVAWSMLGTRTFESWWSEAPAIGTAILTATR